MLYTRRDVGKLALASVPLSVAFGAKINSKFFGVQIGAITYSFNSIANPDAEAIIKAYVEIGLGEAELMSNHCESLASAPSAGGGFGGGGGAGRGAGAAGGAGRGPGGAPGAMAGAPGAMPGGPGAMPGGMAGAPGQTPGGAPGTPGAAAGRGQGRGAGGGGGRTPLTPEQQAARDAAQAKVTPGRPAATPAPWKAVRKKFNDAGIDVARSEERRVGKECTSR